MKVQYRNGEIVVDVYDVMEAMTDADRLKLAESLACFDSIIDFVVQQIAYGCTDNGYFASIGMGRAEPHSALEKARRTIAKESGEVARKEIESLERSIALLQKMYDDLLESRRKYYRRDYQS